MYWAVARLEINRARLALHCLELRHFIVYLPRLRERRVVHGRRTEVSSALFPGYLFLRITNGWWEARWSPGILDLIMANGSPAHVPDAIIDAIRSREVRGLVELAPPPGLRPGAPVRVLCGPLAGQLGLYAGMRPRERIAILLTLLGGLQRVTLPKSDVELCGG
jgi:transcription antitermination factor NusG